MKINLLFAIAIALPLLFSIESNAQEMRLDSNSNEGSFLSPVNNWSHIKDSLMQEASQPARSKKTKNSRLKGALVSKNLIDSSYGYIYEAQLDSALLYKTYYYYNIKGLRDSSIKYKLNQQKWEYNSKYENAYDNNGNKTLDSYYEWDTINYRWVGQFKYEYAFDIYNNKILDIYSKWNSTTDQWDIVSKHEYAYNSKGQQTLYSWFEDAKREYVYDNNGNLISGNYYYWDKALSQWANNTKFEMVYDTILNKFILSTDYIWDRATSKWENRDIIENTYNKNGSIAFSVQYNWDKVANKQIEFLKYEYIYDNADFLIKKNTYNWNKTTSVWYVKSQANYVYNANGKITSIISVNDSKYEYAYDLNGNEVLYAIYTWNSSTNQWKGLGKHEKTFDSLSNITSDIGYNWDETLSQWKPYHKDEYEYDIYGHKTLVNYYWNANTSEWYGERRFITGYDANGNYIYSIPYTWDFAAKQWAFQIKTFYYYSPHFVINGLKNTSSINNLFIYPNPARDILNINIKDKGKAICYIYNNLGELVKSVILIEGQSAISVNDLSKGLYLIKVCIGKNEYVQKLVIE